MSLSARRAWIEMGSSSSFMWAAAVALRKESVDRNEQMQEIAEWGKKSLSARRAWIEIFCLPFVSGWDNRRSPQGERG